MVAMAASVIEELNTALSHFQGFKCGGNGTVDCAQCSLSKQVDLVDPNASEERTVQFSICDLLNVINDEFEVVMEGTQQ